MKEKAMLHVCKRSKSKKINTAEYCLNLSSLETTFLSVLVEGKSFVKNRDCRTTKAKGLIVSHVPENQKSKKKNQKKSLKSNLKCYLFSFFFLLNYILISSIHVPYKYKTFLQFINAGDLIIYPENLLFPLSQLQSENVFFSATPVSFTGF